MSSITIAGRAKANFPETYMILESHYSDAIDGISIIEAKVQEALDDLAPGLTEADLTDAQKRYVGDYVTRLLIPAAIDYYGVKTGRDDSIQGGIPGQQATGMRTSGPGTGRRNYDRIQMLKDLDTVLSARLAELKDTFTGATYATAGIMSTTTSGTLKTVDPQTMPVLVDESPFPFPWTV